MSDTKAPWLEAARHHAQTLADLARVTAERDEAIAALRNLVRHDQADDARNRQPNCIELHEAITILSKHPPKVTT